MPSRIVREGIISSDTIDQLDAESEVFYRRLMSVVDDFGRYDGRPSILKAACYPLRLDKVREADVSRWIAICVKAGAVALYSIDSKPFVVMLKVDRPRAKSSKFPEPPAGPTCWRSRGPEIICTHLRADVNGCQQMQTDDGIGVQTPTSVPYSDSYSSSDSIGNNRAREAEKPDPQPAVPPAEPIPAQEAPAEDAGAYAVARETGLGYQISHGDMRRIAGLIKTHGAEATQAAILDFMGQGIAGRGAIASAETKLAREFARGKAPNANQRSTDKFRAALG